MGSRGICSASTIVRMPTRLPRNAYDPRHVGCLLLYTCHETSLDAQIERPLDEGDLLSNANTVIHLGKIREGTRFRRAMFVSKHRGSSCSDRNHPLPHRRPGYSARYVV